MEEFYKFYSFFTKTYLINELNKDFDFDDILTFKIIKVINN